jgi:gamma-glutamyltranspeptidase/glutathione hydrolase
MAVGTPGGGRILNTILQVLVNVIDFKLNIDEATHQPRISAGEGPLEVEPNFNADTLALLKKKARQSESHCERVLFLPQGRHLLDPK